MPLGSLTEKNAYWSTSAAGSYTVQGRGGNDTITIRTPSYRAAGDAGDVLDGGDGNDILRASYTNDTLLGGLGDDSLSGGAGDDTLDGGDGADLVDGGSGNDTIGRAHV